MNKIFIILFFLFFASPTFAGEKETANPEVMPMGCYVEGKNAFNDRAKVYLKEAEGVMVMYFACNKEVSDWDWYFFRNTDVNISHDQAYKNCVESAKKRKIKDCYLFAINETIVWGKDNFFLAQVEKEAKAKLSIIVEKTPNDICIEGDCINGQGTEKYADGYTYTGQFINGERNGQGTEKYADGYTYTGQFINGNRNGQGTEKSEDGYTYTGQFINGNRNGQGTEKYANGYTYTGQFINGERNGQGTEKSEDGYTYTGQFKNGERNGKGTEKYANGYTYTGQFINGNRNGQGTEKYADGYTYTGQFKDGERNGQGTGIYADGNKYVGEHKNGKRDGKGTYYWADGRKYIGEWKKDNPLKIGNSN